MAKNQNPRRPNNHHLIIGASGSGKSSFLRSKQSPLTAYKNIVFWDIDHDYHAARYTTRAAFARALVSALKSGKAFKIAYSPNDASAANFDFFCKCVWQLGDGLKSLAVVIEELADVTNAGKARPAAGQLIRRGRKYGLDIFAVSQRPAEIDKTTYTQCVNRWCGYVDTETDCKRMAGVMGVSADSLSSLNKLEYFYKKDGERVAKRGKVTIRK